MVKHIQLTSLKSLPIKTRCFHYNKIKWKVSLSSSSSPLLSDSKFPCRYKDKVFRNVAWLSKCRLFCLSGSIAPWILPFFLLVWLHLFEEGRHLRGTPFANVADRIFFILQVSVPFVAWSPWSLSISSLSSSLSYVLKSLCRQSDKVFRNVTMLSKWRLFLCSGSSVALGLSPFADLLGQNLLPSDEFMVRCVWSNNWVQLVWLATLVLRLFLVKCEPRSALLLLSKQETSYHYEAPPVIGEHTRQKTSPAKMT